MAKEEFDEEDFDEVSESEGKSVDSSEEEDLCSKSLLRLLRNRHILRTSWHTLTLAAAYASSADFLRVSYRTQLQLKWVDTILAPVLHNASTDNRCGFLRNMHMSSSRSDLQVTVVTSKLDFFAD